MFEVENAAQGLVGKLNFEALSFGRHLRQSACQNREQSNVRSQRHV